MRTIRMVALLSISGVLLTACATVPPGPSITALPGTGKSFAAFQGDDVACRQWAEQQAGTTPQRAGGLTTAEDAGIGTLLGAGLGAALGAIGGNPGLGAAVGAGAGLARGGSVRHPRRSASSQSGPASIRRRVRTVHVREGQSGAAGSVTRHRHPDVRQAINTA